VSSGGAGGSGAWGGPGLERPGRDVSETAVAMVAESLGAEVDAVRAEPHLFGAGCERGDLCRGVGIVREGRRAVGPEGAAHLGGGRSLCGLERCLAGVATAPVLRATGTHILKGVVRGDAQYGASRVDRVDAALLLLHLNGLPRASASGSARSGGRG